MVVATPILCFGMVYVEAALLRQQHQGGGFVVSVGVQQEVVLVQGRANPDNAQDLRSCLEKLMERTRCSTTIMFQIGLPR